jgi:hypothetical protein
MPVLNAAVTSHCRLLGMSGNIRRYAIDQVFHLGGTELVSIHRLNHPPGNRGNNTV